MVQTKKRNSSIELLRIIAMIDIVMFHYLSRNFNLYAVENSRIAEDVNLWKEMIFQYIDTLESLVLCLYLDIMALSLNGVDLGALWNNVSFMV